VPQYPDPDPQTGESVLSDTLARQLKTDPAFASALKACRDVLPSSTASAVEGG
jgi:hypothetical protein